MKNEKSFTDQEKKRMTSQREKSNSFMMDIYIQMILDEALLKHQLTILEKQIDDALETGNKELFMKHSQRYRSLKQQERR